MSIEQLKLLNQRPIAYYPLYKDLTTSTTAGVLLSQLMYWFSKKEKFYKTDKDILKETHLTASELKTAKSKIKDISFITITREGVPAKTYYKIDWGMYNFSLSEFAKLESVNQTNSDGGIRQSITKTTTKKEREGNFYDDNKSAIDIYILDIFANDKTIRNKEAYKNKMITKFIDGDKATIEVFNSWRFEYNLRQINVSFRNELCSVSGVKEISDDDSFKFIVAKKLREKIQVTFNDDGNMFSITFQDISDVHNRLKIIRVEK